MNTIPDYDFDFNNLMFGFSTLIKAYLELLFLVPLASFLSLFTSSSPQEKEDVPVEMSNGEPGCHYFEQLRYNDMWLKVGDCVFIKSHGLVRPRVGR